MPNDKYQQERTRALATMTSNLNAAHEHLVQARRISAEFALNIEVELDITRAVHDVIDACARAYQQEKAPHE